MRLPILMVAAWTMALSGCESIHGALEQPVWPWRFSGPSPVPVDPPRLCSGSSCTSDDALKAFVQASTYCRSVQNFYEREGRYSQDDQLAINALGAVAGAVIAPIANGTSAKAWSGLAGATNTVQLSVQQAFSTALTAKRREAVVQVTQGAQKQFTDDARDPGKQVVDALNMAENCSMASASADVAALQAAVGSAPTANQSSTSTTSTTTNTTTTSSTVPPPAASPPAPTPGGK